MNQQQILKFFGPVIVAVARDGYGWFKARSKAKQEGLPLPDFDVNMFAASVIMGIAGGIGLNLEVGQ